MISDLDETIRQLLIQEAGFDPAEIEVSFQLPNREWSAGISRPTVNCYLFDIRENAALRQQGWTMEQQKNGSARRHAPIRFDLTYLLTVWTRAVEDEHRLLWHTLHTLTRFPTLPERYTQGTLREHELPLYADIARPSGALKSPVEFWSALDNQMRPSLNYSVTLAMSREAVPAGPPVQTTTFRFRQLDGAVEEQVGFGGTVCDGAGVPVGGATVELTQPGLHTTTNALGRFYLGGMSPGQHSVVVRHGDNREQHDITVPASNYTFTLASLPTTQAAMQEG